MNMLASSMEIGAHPATALLLGGLVAAILRGRFASATLVIAPPFLDFGTLVRWKSVVFRL